MTYQPSVSVIVPALDEAANLTLVLPQLSAGYEVVLVDGHSTDATVATARALRPDVVVVQQTRRGKGNALACGLQVASGDVVVTFAADHSFDAAEIPHLVRALVEGADVATVRCSDHADGAGRTGARPATDWVHRAARAASATVDRHLTDPCSGYTAFWRDLLPVLHLPDVTPAAPAAGMRWGDGFEVDALITCRFAAAGARVAELPGEPRPRAFGESHRRPWRDRARVLRTLAAEQGCVRALR